MAAAASSSDGLGGRSMMPLAISNGERDASATAVGATAVVATPGKSGSVAGEGASGQRSIGGAPSFGLD